MVKSYVDDGLADGNDAVHDGHEAAGDGRDHGVELGYVSDVAVLVAWHRFDLRRMRRRPFLRCCVVCFVLGWCYWLSETEAVACSGGMLVVNGGREEEENRDHRMGVSNAFLRGYTKECSRVVTR